MARRFRHLTPEQRRSIIVGYLGDEPKLAIARRLGIDNATVHYHINKVRDLPREQVYALIAPRCGPCERGHLSFKCLVCGTPHDNVVNEEFQHIASLRRRIESLEAALANHGTTIPPEIKPIAPIISIRL